MEHRQGYANGVVAAFTNTIKVEERQSNQFIMQFR